MFKCIRDFKFAIAIVAVLCVSVIICFCAFSFSGKKIAFEAEYYFVCYRVTDNSISASSISGTVSSYGGAGYILNHGKNYYITVSCYYNKTDADTVCTSLRKRDLDCTVLKISTKNFKIKGSAAQRNEELYLGNLNTLHTLSMLAYECANGLDTGEYTQNNSKSVVGDIKQGLIGLLHSNGDNCFTPKLNSLIAECEDKEVGFLLSKDMRYLQIAVIDTIVNTELY